MEQQQRYLDDRRFGEVADLYQLPLPLPLGVSNIKIENDLGLYRGQTSQYISGSQSSNSAVDFSQSSQVCNPAYVKNRTLHQNTSTDLCNGIRMYNMTSDDANFNVHTLSSTLGHPSAGTSTLDSNLDQINVTARYRYQGPDLGTAHQPPCSKPQLVSSSTEIPQQDDRMQPCTTQSNAQHLTQMRFDGGKKSGDHPQNVKRKDDHESRQAFDLTCRSRSPSKEGEASGDDSPSEINESSALSPEHSSQIRCVPKPQTCKVCGKVLSSPSSYYVHMKVHSGNKPYACTVCEASFCRKPYLEVHMRTHTGERPFECNMCLKRFTQKSSLNTHKRVHTGEKPYSCDICHKEFAVKSYVTAHRWSHVSEKPLECQRCGLSFTSKNLFAIHIRTHFEQNHECHICGRTFMKDSYLIRHQNRVHRDPNVNIIYPDDTRSSSTSPRDNTSEGRSSVPP